MSYFAIHEIATGRLKSMGSVIADPLPAGLTAVDIVNPPLDSEMWDEATKTFIARPPKVLADRLEDLKARPAFRTFWQSLNQQQKDTLITALKWLLGRARWRNQSGSQVIDPEGP